MELGFPVVCEETEDDPTLDGGSPPTVLNLRVPQVVCVPVRYTVTTDCEPDPGLVGT